MFYLIALGFYPVMLALVIPIGLLLTAIAAKREKLDAEVRVALAPLVGLAAVIAGISLLLHLGASTNVLVPVLLVLNLLSIFVLVRGRFPRPDLKLLFILFGLGLVAYAAVISPLLADGQPGVLGYGVNNDPAFHAIMPEYLDANGYDFPAPPVGGFAEAATDKFVAQGYPDGWHQILLLAMRVFGLRAFFLFNFAEAFFAALLVPVAYIWLRKIGVSRLWAAGGGLVAGIGYTQLTYAFQGFAPQVAVTPFLYAGLFLLYEVVEESRRGLYLLLPALVIQAGLAIYSFTILLWMGVFLLCLAVYKLGPGRRSAELKGDFMVVTGIFALAVFINPFSVISMGMAFKMVTGWSAADSMGNLISRAVPILPISGIWLTGDHRGLPIGLSLMISYVASVLVALVVLAGLRLKPGRLLLIVGLVTMIIPIGLLKIAASPYYFSKTIQLAGPVISIGVVAGLYWLSRQHQWRYPVVFLAVLYLAGVVLSGQRAAEFTTAAPDNRMEELFTINDRFSDKREPALFVETGEDWGKYALSNLNVASPFAMSYKGGAPDVRPILAGANVHDLDSLSGVLGREYPIVVIAKEQDISLAPPPFELVFAGKFYNVYKTNRRGLEPSGHRPFETLTQFTNVSYLELDPGESVSVRIDRKHKAVLISAYLWSGTDVPAAKGLAIASSGGRRVVFQVKQTPEVYMLPVPGGSRGQLTVKNNADMALRLDWVAPLSQLHDQAKLFRYNDKNKQVFQAVERLMGR